MPDMLKEASHIIVTTGPESSGKTTIATALSSQLPAPLVSEASRDYLNALYARNAGAPYQERDLLEIAKAQVALEQQALINKPKYLVCDTDLLVIVIWSEVKFARCDQALLDLFNTSLSSTKRSYLLCDPEIPWEADPLRENPLDREELFKRYHAKLEALKLPYTHLQGSQETRLAHALESTLP